MPAEPYTERCEEELILRDHLAIDRTRLANERTLLSYVRAGLAMLVVGLSFLEFAESTWMHGFAYVFIAAAVVVLAWGVRRFRHFQRNIYHGTPAIRRDD